MNLNFLMNSKLLLIDKEAGWTSFDVVAKVRGLAGVKKVGHAGTLDPFATGLLLILVGKEATKKQDEYMKKDKEYEATLELGKISDTGDPEGVIEKKDDAIEVVKKDIEGTLQRFVGEIEQIPPAHSAIKINGKRAYELARKGEKVKLKSRKVTINDIEIMDYKWPYLRIRVKCGSGTYIRSLASDIGKTLGTGAYLTELRRTKIGEYDIKNARTISRITASLSDVI